MYFKFCFFNWLSLNLRSFSVRIVDTVTKRPAVWAFWKSESQDWNISIFINIAANKTIYQAFAIFVEVDEICIFFWCFRRMWSFQTLSWTVSVRYIVRTLFLCFVSVHALQCVKKITYTRSRWPARYAALFGNAMSALRSCTAISWPRGIVVSYYTRWTFWTPYSLDYLSIFVHLPYMRQYFILWEFVWQSVIIYSAIFAW